MPVKKSKPKRSMPRITSAPASSRKRRKDIAARVAAAVSMPEELYGEVIAKRLPAHDNNFSGYVRDLIRADLAMS